VSEPRQFSRRGFSTHQTDPFGTIVYVLPLWNPIRVAEEIAMLDNLTEGRLECGFGAGIGPFSFAAYNVPWDDKRQITLEALRVIKGIWTHASFTFEGRYFKCKEVDLSIPLVQKPHPPLWMPTRSKESIEEAASTGISTVQWVPAGNGCGTARLRRVPRSLSTR
jgi:alkanesulfonate monooxygenase SsuD/methylene tetrahydromethanopterin reductase-like flavin-dependent oxidoreductase (luciferase family)